MSEWVAHESMVLKNCTADQDERGPVYENEYLTLLHAGAGKTARCHSGKLKPPPSCQLWVCLVGYTAWYFTWPALNCPAKLPLLWILCLLLPTGTDDGWPWPPEDAACVSLVEIGSSSHTQMGLKATDSMNLLFFLLQMRSQDIW